MQNAAQGRDNRPHFFLWVVKGRGVGGCSGNRSCDCEVTGVDLGIFVTSSTLEPKYV